LTLVALTVNTTHQRYGGEAAMATQIPVNHKILQKARELIDLPLGKGRYVERRKLQDIISGKKTRVDVEWWREANSVADWQIENKHKTKTDKLIAKLTATADPANNAAENERQKAQATIATLQTQTPPTPPIAPGLEEYERRRAQRKAQLDHIDTKWDEVAKTAAARQGDSMRNTATKPVNTTARPAARPKPAPVNTPSLSPSPLTPPHRRSRDQPTVTLSRIATDIRPDTWPSTCDDGGQRRGKAARPIQRRAYKPHRASQATQNRRARHWASPWCGGGKRGPASSRLSVTQIPPSLECPAKSLAAPLARFPPTDQGTPATRSMLMLTGLR
jgi:hypothetical protein